MNQSNEHTNELVQEVIGKDGLSMTVDIASSENGIHGYFGKLFMLKLSHVVHHYSQIFALKSRPETCVMGIKFLIQTSTQ